MQVEQRWEGGKSSRFLCNFRDNIPLSKPTSHDVDDNDDDDDDSDDDDDDDDDDDNDDEDDDDDDAYDDDDCSFG